MMQSTTLAHAPTVDADADAAPERLTARVLAERIAATWADGVRSRTTSTAGMSSCTPPTAPMATA